MPKPIIEVENVSKLYHLGAVGSTTLRESFNRIWRQKDYPQKPAGSDEFWALRDVSFSVQPGEVVGIIGKNGAGKSTLLKILSRITEPTSGKAVLRGTVASLLEVGTGFHPELTGRENIYLNGAILGMRKAGIDQKMDEIIDFAEVQKFVDTPVKHYSSGMYVRLAFAVAAHLEAEILVIDEVLAVGDIGFQKKCLGRMDEVAKQGRTVLFVSHNMAAVTALCSRVVILSGGKVFREGAVGDCVFDYFATANGESVLKKKFESAHPDFEILEIEVSQGGEKILTTSRETTVAAIVRVRGISRDVFVCGWSLTDQFGVKFLSSYWNDLGEDRGSMLDGDYRLSCTIPSNFLNEGNFLMTFNVGIAKVRAVTEESVHFLSFSLQNINGVGSRFGLGLHWRKEPVVPYWRWNLDEKI